MFWRLIHHFYLPKPVWLLSISFLMLFALILYRFVEVDENKHVEHNYH
ncbi:unnamed protein product [Schistosoma curassoni]|uniref:Inner membrane protein n=1 Tax=Schistosoma curassoni TaxID=6186 RepID=A0A183KLY7_9TREM|nr:unnamed protein product [Schistosoma curassoni]